MDHYIRKLKIESLFDDKNTVSIDFIENVNCIYGVNGSGKTTIISLLVASLSCDIKKIANLLFKKAFIYIAPAKKRQPKLFLTVERDIANRNIRYKFEGDLGDFNFPLDSEGDLHDRGRLPVLEILKKNLALTYVPLTRMQESEVYDYERMDDYLLQKSLINRSLPRDEIESILDPSKRMLTNLERMFRERYARVQDVIGRDLESLKTKILTKILLDHNYVEKAFNLTKSGVKRPNVKKDQIGQEAKAYYDKLQSAKINIPKAAVDEHFQTLHEMVRAIEDGHDQLEKEKENQERRDEINRQIGDAFMKYFMFAPMIQRFNSIIDDIEESSMKKERLLKVFRDTEAVINGFLINKSFTFTSVGGLLVKCGDRQIRLEDLSSGEKHLIALLGRVALSPSEGAVFIADEPELSLHLEWQRKIIPAITALSHKMQVIVATHSPAVIPRDSNQINLAKCFK